VTDQADIVAVERILADLAAGHDEMVPAEFANRLIAGEKPIRVYRALRGLSSRELAEKAEISAPYLSEIESGKKDGSLSAMRRIADVLKVGLDDLV
jgi:DNA-binding XRE family transcriptional regulator